MFDRSDLDRLVGAMRAHSVTTLEIDTKGERLRLVLPAAAPSSPLPVDLPKAPPLAAKSPCIGTFLRRGSDDGLAPLAAGDPVVEGDVLGYVCQGLVRVPVIAPAAGHLEGDMPEEDAVVGYGDPLFSVDPDR